MRYPKLQPIPQSVTSQIEFRGLNRQYTASEREFVDMLNISSEKYPVLAPRKRRYSAQIRGASGPILDCLAQDGVFWWMFNNTSTHTTQLCHTTATGGTAHAVMEWGTPAGEYHPKLVYMNGYICVFPDCLFYKIDGGKKIGARIDRYFPDVTWTDTDALGVKAGSNFGNYLCANAAGLDQILQDGDYITLRFPRGSETTGSGDPSQTGTYYTRVSHVTNQYVVFDNSGMNLNSQFLVDLRVIRNVPPLDHVCVSQNRLWATSKRSLPAHTNNTFYASSEIGETTYEHNVKWLRLKSPHFVSTDMTVADIQDICEQKLRVVDVDGTIAEVRVRAFGTEDAEPDRVPQLLLTVPETWDQTAGAAVAENLRNGNYWIAIDWDQTEIKYNTIYASEQGVPYSWDCFEGTEMDSYAVDVSSEGDWTGIFPYKNTVYAFKEDTIHSVYGYYPSAYRMSDENFKGVKAGCEDTTVMHNNVMYFYSTDGLVAYSGRKPVIVDRPLNDVFGTGEREICCSSDKDRLLFCTEKGLFVYDSLHGMWQKHNNRQYLYAISVNGDTVLVYEQPRDGQSYTDIYLEAEQKAALTALGFADNAIVQEGDLDWMAQSARILLYGGEGTRNSSYNITQKYVDRIYVKADIPLGARLDVYISYDDGDFEAIATQGGYQIGLRVIPIIPRRCDHFSLRFNGHGEAKVISVTKSISAGSEVVHHAV